MLAIQSSLSGTKVCTPNIIPCRIHHNGPIKITKRYWAPVPDKEDGTQTAYFRGRRLRGRTVKLPVKYQGIVLKMTERSLPQTTSGPPVPQYESEEEEDEDEHDDELPAPVKILETTSTFNDLVVWGHDQIPASDDPLIKNIDEWIGFAEAIHTNACAVDTATNGNDTKDASST